MADVSKPFGGLFRVPDLGDTCLSATQDTNTSVFTINDLRNHRDVHHGLTQSQMAAHPPTGAFELTDVVAGKPAGLPIERPLPPAAVLLAGHADDVTLGEGELIFVGLLEVEACLHQQLLMPAVLRHVLGKHRRRGGGDEGGVN